MEKYINPNLSMVQNIRNMMIDARNIARAQPEEAEELLKAAIQLFNTINSDSVYLGDNPTSAKADSLMRQARVAGDVRKKNLGRCYNEYSSELASVSWRIDSGD